MSKRTKSPLFISPSSRSTYMERAIEQVILGLLLLTIIGAVFLIARKTPREFVAPLLGLFILSLLFLIVLARGSSYGGIRHVPPVVPLLALLASLAIYKAVESKSYLLHDAIVVALIASLASAIPVLRPWEYFNETVGGTANGHRYFNDEGIDLGLRSKELVEYYNQNLKPTGEIPVVFYFAPYLELKKRGLDYVGRDPERDYKKMNSKTFSGTVILGAMEFVPSLW